MRRAGRIILRAAGLVVGLALLGLGGVVLGANTGPGRRAIERLVPRLTGGKLRVEGLGGRFPDALRAGHITVADANGIWLTIDDARLDWSPLGLLHGELEIERLAATHVSVARLPVSSGAASSPPEAPPVGIDVAAFRIDRLDLAAPVVGVAARLGVTGNLRVSPGGHGVVALDAERLDAAGSYRLGGALSREGLTGRVEIAEPAGGLVSRMAGLPDLGPVALTASLAGPLNAERARLSLSAGPLTAQGNGSVDLTGKMLSVDLTAAAPAMTPSAGLSWQSVRVEAHIHGSFARPEAAGRLDIAALQAGGWSLDGLTARIGGSAGSVGLDAVLSGLRIPGTQPDLLSAAPVTVQASAILDTPQRPLIFTLSHPLLSVSGAIDTGATPGGTVAAAAPALAPLAALAGLDIQGRAALSAQVARQGGAVRVDAAGAVAVTGGMPAATALLGDNATLALNATLRGGDVVLDAFRVNGRAVQLSASGSDKGGVLALDWQAGLSDLSAITRHLAGTVTARGHIGGPPDDLALSAEADGLAGVAGAAKEKLAVSLRAKGLPSAPSGTIAAQGRLAGAPLTLAAALSRRADGTLDLALERLDWKSASGSGRLSLAPGAALPVGRMQVRVTRLADLALAPLLGIGAAGSLNATLDTVIVQGRPQAHLTAALQRLSLGDAGADRVTVDARVDDPAASPRLTLTATADGVREAGIAGNARLTAKGNLQALALTLSSQLQTPRGPATLAAAGTVRLPQHELQLASLTAAWSGETARLLAPARIAFAPGLAIDDLRLGVGGATLALAGKVAPALALTVSARNVTPALAKPFLPGANGSGTLAFDGRLSGTPAAPEGSLRLTGRGLRLAGGGFGGFPAADLDATGMLARGAVRVDARLSAGKFAHLRLAGTVPLRPGASADLHLTGSADLTMLDPILTPGGSAARGEASLDLGFAGPLTAPRASGTIRLSKASIQDFAEGVHITEMNGLIRAEGDAFRIAQLSGRAGSGTISVSGTIGLFQPKVPVALTVTARKARPLASDLVSATINADLTVRGQAFGALTVAGDIHVDRADINIPDQLPQGVATLEVRRPGAKAPPAPASPRPAPLLALTVAAPEQVFVRGHGIDAEMGGTLKLAGSAAAPSVSGGFELRRGTLSLAGQTLTFTSGKVAFGGSDLTKKLDPTINFVAQSTANNVTATLAVTGYADAPKISLSSSPDLPQDQILGQLLFGQNPRQLSMFQLAAVGQALAALGGVGGGDPLAAVRTGLGLDRLSVGGGTGGTSGATLEAGKYVAKGVYVGAKQGVSGGSQAQVQIDLTRHLKLESTLGTNSGTPVTGITPQNDPGSSIGLSYQFEY